MQRVVVMTKRNEPHRTIEMQPARARQIKMASGYLGISGEQFIQGAISRALHSLAMNDKAFSMILGEVADES